MYSKNELRVSSLSDSNRNQLIIRGTVVMMNHESMKRKIRKIWILLKWIGDKTLTSTNQQAVHEASNLTEDTSSKSFDAAEVVSKPAKPYDCPDVLDIVVPEEVYFVLVIYLFTIIIY